MSITLPKTLVPSTNLTCCTSTMNKDLSGFMFKQDDVVDPGPIKAEEVEVRPNHVKSEVKVEDD